MNEFTYMELLERIAVALEKIAENTETEKDEERTSKIKGFDAGFNPGGK